MLEGDTHFCAGVGADPCREVDAATEHAGRRGSTAALLLRTAQCRSEPRCLESGLETNREESEERQTRFELDIAAFLLFFPMHIKGENVVAFVAEPDEVIGILCHIPYHLQEVVWVLSNRLTKGQCLNTHVEPQEKHKKTIKRHRQNDNICSLDKRSFCLKSAQVLMDNHRCAATFLFIQCNKGVKVRSTTLPESMKQ